MRRNKTKKTKLVAILLTLVFLISIGYAALTTNLTITGNATVKIKTFIVYFDNVEVKTGSVSGAKVTTAPTTSGTTTTTLNWEVSMDTPGEFYEFNVDVINAGNVDAMVNTATNSIVTSTLTSEQQQYLDYSIKYINGAEIEQYDKLAAGETKTITVKLVFKQDINPEDLPETVQNGISLSYSANYVQADNNAVTKVTEVAGLEIGDIVNYTTTLNGQTLSDWRVFYVDGGYTYIILDDYLPSTAISDTIKTNHNLYTNGNYGIRVDFNRENLLNAMTTKSNWDSLLTGSINGHEVNQIRTANVWAMGAPTVDLWVNSWNTIYPSDTLYTRYIDTEDVDNQNFYATGYAVSDTTPITRTKEIDLAGKSGYNNTLYFPHKTTDDPYWVFGYWLASPAASTNECVVNVEYDGIIYYNGFCDAWDFAFRPVICLPTSIVNQ